MIFCAVNTNIFFASISPADISVYKVMIRIYCAIIKIMKVIFQTYLYNLISASFKCEILTLFIIYKEITKNYLHRPLQQRTVQRNITQTESYYI